jgi:phosphatidylserine/phosphatidylglycerophosphate/cardiolipin synthase-like enzyme
MMKWRVVLSVMGLALALLGAPFANAASPSITAYFSPWDDAEGAIVLALKRARQQVLVQAYLLTSQVIADELMATQARGVEVKVLADQEMMRKGNDKQLKRLLLAGMPVWLETRYAAAHNKVIVIDGNSDAPVVVTGSYNFTWSAQARNAENLLVIEGDRGLARRYAANWQRHREDATEYLVDAVPNRDSMPSAPTFK